MIKLDLHIHSQYSEDACGTPKEIMKLVKKKGLQGMAITDHNTVKSREKVLALNTKDFIAIPGIEISTKDGHLLGLNVSTVIPSKLSVQETVELIYDDGGIPIVPHLFRNMSGIKPEKLSLIQNRITAIEVFNGCSQLKTNLKTGQLAEQLNLGGTGGSDAHDPRYAGLAYTTVDATDTSIDGVLEAIEQRQTWGEGTTLPFSYRRDRMILSIKQFFHRGFKRI